MSRIQEWKIRIRRKPQIQDKNLEDEHVRASWLKLRSDVIDKCRLLSHAPCLNPDKLTKLHAIEPLSAAHILQYASHQSGTTNPSTCPVASPI